MIILIFFISIEFFIHFRRFSWNFQLFGNILPSKVMDWNVKFLKFKKSTIFGFLWIFWYRIEFDLIIYFSINIKHQYCILLLNFIFFLLLLLELLWYKLFVLLFNSKFNSNMKNILYHLILSYVVLYHIISCFILLYFFIYILSYQIISYYVMSYYFIS